MMVAGCWLLVYPVKCEARTISLGLLVTEHRLLITDLPLPTSNFQLPTSNFQLPTSNQNLLKTFSFLNNDYIIGAYMIKISSKVNNISLVSHNH